MTKNLGRRLAVFENTNSLVGKYNNIIIISQLEQNLINTSRKSTCILQFRVGNNYGHP